MNIKYHTANDKFHFTIRLNDNEVVATSREYETKSECKLMASIIINEWQWNVIDNARKFNQNTPVKTLLQ